MGKSIPLQIVPSTFVEIDGALVARDLDLPLQDFRQLMQDGKVTVLCERGTGEDAGLYRASFYYKGKRARLVVDAEGQPRSSAAT